MPIKFINISINKIKDIDINTNIFKDIKCLTKKREQ